MSKPKTILQSISIATAVTGLAVSSFLAGKKIAHKKLSASDVLTKIKSSFTQEGPIEGSWIESHPVPFQKFAFKTQAYQGGISRYEDAELISYEFLADANTGTLLQLNRI